MYELIHAADHATSEHETEPDAYAAAVDVYGVDIYSLETDDQRQEGVRVQVLWRSETEYLADDDGHHAVAEIIRID